MIDVIETSISLDRLRAFQRVAQTRSFSRAAALLGVDRARVSRVISALERELGARLFVRTTRSVAPTPEGEALARRIAAPLDELARAVQATPAQATVLAGEVTLTATADVGRVLIAPLLAGFRTRYPEVRLRLALSDELIGETAGADLALRFGRAGGQTAVARRLRRYDTGLYAAPAYLDRRGAPRTMADLGEHDGLWPVVRGRKSFAPRAAPPPPAIGCGDFATVAELARTGAGVAVLPTFVAAPWCVRGELVRVLPAVSLGSAVLYLVSAPPARLPARTAALRAFLIEHLG